MASWLRHPVTLPDEALASAGNLVVAPNHRDATCNGGGARWIDRPEQSFGKPETWDETAWTDLHRTFHEPIVAYSIAFLDRSVRGSDASPLLTHPTPTVALLRHRVESEHQPTQFDVNYPPDLSAGEHDER